MEHIQERNEHRASPGQGSASIVELIEKSVLVLSEPESVVEIRIPKAGKLGTLSGYFDSPAALAQAVRSHDGNVPGIYFTLNPANHALLAR